MNENAFAYEGMDIKTRFEKEANFTVAWELWTYKRRAEGGKRETIVFKTLQRTDAQGGTKEFP